MAANLILSKSIIVAVAVPCAASFRVDAFRPAKRGLGWLIRTHRIAADGTAEADPCSITMHDTRTAGLAWASAEAEEIARRDHAAAVASAAPAEATTLVEPVQADPLAASVVAAHCTEAMGCERIGDTEGAARALKRAADKAAAHGLDVHAAIDAANRASAAAAIIAAPYEAAARAEGWTVDGGMFVHHGLRTTAEASPLDPEGWEMLCREHGLDAAPMVPQPVQPQQADAGAALEPARNMVEAMARAYEAARDGRAAEPIYATAADAARDVRAALDAGWHLDAGAAALGDWPWWRSVESCDGGPLDVRAVRRDDGWRLYIESAAEALAEWPYVAEPASPAPGSHRAVMLALDAFEAAPWLRPLVEINPRPAPVLDVLPPAPARPFAPFLDMPTPAPRSMADVWQSLAVEFGPPLVMHRPALALEPEPRGPWDVLSVGEAFALYLAAACFGLALVASFI